MKRHQWSRLIVFALSCAILIDSAAAQSSEIRPNENLILEGIPKIPSTIAEDLARYQGRSARLFDWHPKANQVLIGTRFGETTQVHVVKAPDGDRRQLTFFSDPVLSASYQPKNGDYFIYTKDTNGSGLSQIFRYRTLTGEVALITDGKSRNGDYVWSNSGTRIAYRSSSATTRSLRIVEPADPATDRLLTTVNGNWYPVAWSPDDRQILAIQSISVNERFLWLIDVASGRSDPILPNTNKDERISYGDGAFSRDGRGVFVTTDQNSEFLRLAYIDLNTSRPTYLTSQIKWNVEAFALSPVNNTIAFVTNEDGVSRLRLLNPGSRAEKIVSQIPVGLISNLRWHSNGTELGFDFESAKSPGDVFSLNVKKGIITRWTESETGSISTAETVEPKLITWQSFDGRRISGFLYAPPKRFVGRRPVIIDIHGGPELQATPGFLRGRDRYFVNELGIAIILPNIRGSSGYGKTFLTLDDGLRREDAYKDIGALLEWIAANPTLDPARVMVSGVSYGAGTTLAVAARYNDLIRCSWAGAPTSNFVTLLHARPDRRSEYGDERDPQIRAFFERIAPLNQADKITKPVFILVGKNDPITPPSEAEQMLKALKKNGAPVWYMMAVDEGHGYVKRRNLEFTENATVLFVRENLLK